MRLPRDGALRSRACARLMLRCYEVHICTCMGDGVWSYGTGTSAAIEWCFHEYAKHHTTSSTTSFQEDTITQYLTKRLQHTHWLHYNHLYWVIFVWNRLITAVVLIDYEIMMLSVGNSDRVRFMCGSDRSIKNTESVRWDCVTFRNGFFLVGRLRSQCNFFTSPSSRLPAAFIFVWIAWLCIERPQRKMINVNFAVKRLSSSWNQSMLMCPTGRLIRCIFADVLPRWTSLLYNNEPSTSFG